MALGSIFGGFWDHLGSQVGTKMAPKSKKMESQNDVGKWVEVGRLLEALGWVLGSQHENISLCQAYGWVPAGSMRG